MSDTKNKTHSDKQSSTQPPAAYARLSDKAAHLWEDELRGRLGLPPLDTPRPPAQGKSGWILTAVITLIAAITRFVSLSHPKELVFDETYYVKDAYSLLTLGYEGAWADDTNPAFESGDFSGLSTTDPAYVVHPPFGKWLMAIGQALFGSDSSFGWRFSTALFGVLAVIVIIRIALLMFNSLWLAGLAGTAMALDGMGIVMSRTAILDNILAFFILAGFWALIRDRLSWNARLAHLAALSPMDRQGNLQQSLGPSLFYRPWLIIAGVLLGASCGVKWSGIYAIAVFGILVFIWGLSARKLIGTRRWFSAGIVREGIPAFIQLVFTAYITYIATWTSWFANTKAWGRTWAESVSPEELPVPFLPKAVNSLLHYHKDMWDFHNGLNSPHDYQSQPWMWIIQGRPVSFYWKGSEDMGDACNGTECVQAITSIGNIAVWWIGILALFVVIILGIRMIDWRAEAILAGYAATWLPWFFYTDRTIFQFYAVVMLPFVALAIAWAAGALTHMLSKPFNYSHSLSSVFAGFAGTWKEADTTGTLFVDFPSHDTPARHDDIRAYAVAQETENTLPASHIPVSTPAQTDDTPLAVHPDVSVDNDTVDVAEDSHERIPSNDDLNIFARIAKRLSRDTSPHNEWWQTRTTSSGKLLVSILNGLIALIALLWWPIWTGMTISHDYWHLHMFFDAWI